MSNIKTTFAPTPKAKKGGEFLKLKDYEGSVVALYCHGQENYKTRFGERVAAIVMAVTMKEVIPQAVLMASFASGMEPGKWYAGEVTREGQAWALGKIGEKEISALALRIDKARDAARKAGTEVNW